MLFSSANLDNSNCVEEIGKTFSLWFVCCTYVLIYGQGRELFSYIQHSGSPEPAFGISLIVSRFFNLYPSVETRKNNKSKNMKSILCSTMVVILVCLFMTSCNSDKKKEVSVHDVELSGWLSGDWADVYFKAEDGAYTFVKNGDKLTIDVPLTVTKDIPNRKIEKVEGIMVGLLDINGNEINDVNGDWIIMKLANYECTKSIPSAKAGTQIPTKFQYGLLTDETLIDKIGGFKMYVDIKLSDEEIKEHEEVNDNTITSANVDSEDWDKALDDYEAYIDSYIKLLKKAQAGDMSAMTEYPTCLEKAEAFGKKFDNAKGSMSTKQMKRYMEITTKMTTAIK